MRQGEYIVQSKISINEERLLNRIKELGQVGRDDIMGLTRVAATDADKAGRGGLATDEALASVGTDGTILGEELKRIGYAGEVKPGFIKPYE